MKNELEVSYLSNVVYLSDGRGVGGARLVADGLAVFCRARDEGGRWADVGPSAVELLDGAETLLPHFLPERFGGVWDGVPGAPRVLYDRGRDVLVMFNDKVAVSSHLVADNLVVGCDGEGYPVSVELTGAAALLLPYLLPVSEDVMANAKGR